MLILLGTSTAVPARAADKEQKVAVGEFQLSGPYSHENLTIFLVHGEDKIASKNLVTLQEALEQKKVVVHETGSVSDLAIENVSRDVDVFIQSGDILKGGRQDRLISFSMIVPAQSGKVPLAAYCVEQGRWHQRGQEAPDQFGSSTTQLPSKELKVYGGSYGQLGGSSGVQGGALARSPLRGPAGAGFAGGFGALGGGGLGFAGGGFGAGGGNFQGAVWKGVDDVQRKLMKNAGAEVQAQASPSSLQLTLENKKVKQTVAKYTQQLAPIVEKHRGVIGYAVAINGKVNSAEVYGSAALFHKLWPKLLQASATEALTDLQKGKKFDPVTADVVKARLFDADQDKTQGNLVLTQKALTKRITVMMQETDQVIFLETRDREQKAAWIHRSYFVK
jgi:hypothetical protein